MTLLLNIFITFQVQFWVIEQTFSIKGLDVIVLFVEGFVVVVFLVNV